MQNLWLKISSFGEIFNFSIRVKNWHMSVEICNFLSPFPQPVQPTMSL